MRIDKITVKAQQALTKAQEIAANSKHSSLTPLHVLAGLMHEEEGGIITAILGGPFFLWLLLRKNRSLP